MRGLHFFSGMEDISRNSNSTSFGCKVSHLIAREAAIFPDAEMLFALRILRAACTYTQSVDWTRE